MKVAVVVATVGLAWFGCATAATAYSFAPRSASFTGAGRMSLSAGGLGADCAAVFAGVTDEAGAGKITSAVFSGGLLGACGGVRPIGLPWTITPVGPGRALISAVAVKSSLIGDCGPGDVPITLADRGVIKIGRVSLGTKCSINAAALTTKPILTVVGR